MKASKYYSFNLKKRPFQIFVFTAIILFTLSFFPTNKNLYINISNTSTVISWGVIYRILSGFLILVWILYILIKKRLLSKKFIWVHGLTTILPILAAIICFNLTPEFNAPAQHKLQTSPTNYWIFSLLLFFAVSAQFILILNIAGGIVKRLTKKKGRILIHDSH
jgi:hypothetical protein